jgi:small GTP-binding protein
MKSVFQSLFSKESNDSSSSSSGKSIFSNWFGIGSQPKKLLLLGLDCAGKTTFLYRIRSQYEIETAYPTIGFNIETLQLKGLSFKCWDVGGCDKIRPLWIHFMRDVGGIVFMVDSTDRDRFDSAREELGFFLSECSPEVPMLIISNKVDMYNSRPIMEVIKGLRLDEIRNRRWEIIPSSMTSPEYPGPCLEWIRLALTDSDQLSQFYVSHGGMSWRNFFLMYPDGFSEKSFPKVTMNFINEKLPSRSSPVVVPPAASFPEEITTRNEMKPSAARVVINNSNSNDEVAKQVQAHDQAKLEIIWQDWFSRASNCSSLEPNDDETFLKQFSSFSLSSWDHYNHIRIAYLLISRSHSIHNGFHEIQEGIRQYISNNTTQQSNGKSFHMTMTRFWCHMVLYWMLRFNVESANEDNTANGNEKMKHSNNDFHGFMQFVYNHRSSSTDIASSTVFRNYFSNDQIFSPAARMTVVPPNVASLPDLLTMMKKIHQEMNNGTEDDQNKLPLWLREERNSDIRFIEENRYWELR